MAFKRRTGDSTRTPFLLSFAEQEKSDSKGLRPLESPFIRYPHTQEIGHESFNFGIGRCIEHRDLLGP